MTNINQTNSFSVEMEELTSCPNCQSNDLQVWRQGYDRLNETCQQRFCYSQCQTCQLVFLSSRPVEQEIYQFYPQDYEPYQPNQSLDSSSNSIAEDNLTKAKSWLKTCLKNIITPIFKLHKNITADIFPQSVEQQLENFYEPTEAGQTLLDFGCGSEQFLALAQKRGWNPIGLDFSEQVVQQVRDRGYHALLISPEVWDEIENESIDFVRMNHVFEHLYHPKEDLQAVYKKMKPGAKLHIAVPNPYGVASRIFRSNWWGLECPRHVMLYPSSLLETILTDSKYSQVETFYRSIVKDFLRSLGYVLYDLGIIERDQVGKMAQKRYLNLILYPFAWLASTFTLADRFDILCEKTRT